MIGLRFSRLPKHRKFSYSPIYYDENKESLHQHVRRIKEEMGEVEPTEQSVKESIRRAYRIKEGRDRFASNPLERFYSLRIILIASIIGLTFYYLLDSDFLVYIFEKLNK